MNTFTNTRTLTAIGLALALTACGAEQDLASQESINEPVLSGLSGTPNYQFAAHEAPEHVTAVREFDVDSCQQDCIDRWEPSYDECRWGGTIDQPHDTCAQSASDRINVCIKAFCTERLEMARPPQCASRCDDEARSTTYECVAEYGLVYDCLTEGDDVFQTCFDAECQDIRPADSHAEYGTGDKHSDAQGSLTDYTDEPLTCQEICEDLDNKVYLQCVTEPNANVVACRERKGVVYRACVQSHCMETVTE